MDVMLLARADIGIFCTDVWQSGGEMFQVANVIAASGCEQKDHPAHLRPRHYH